MMMFQSKRVYCSFEQSDWLIDWSIDRLVEIIIIHYFLIHIFFFLKKKQNSKWAAHMKTGDSNDMFQKE